jgi:hypothetical protein
MTLLLLLFLLFQPQWQVSAQTMGRYTWLGQNSGSNIPTCNATTIPSGSSDCWPGARMEFAAFYDATTKNFYVFGGSGVDSFQVKGKISTL